MKTRKKIYGGLLMAAAALLCLAGCKKDEEGEKITLGTQFEKSVSAQKTYLGDGNELCWSTGDKVKVNGTVYSVSAEGIEVDAADNYYAVYPATDGNSVDENGGMVTLPASQTYTLENGKQVLNGPMAAHLDASSGILYFKNLYSLLKVTVSADDKDFTVSSITVTATGDNARALTGTYDFSFRGATTEDPNTAPTVGDIASGSSKVTLINIAVKVSAGEDKDFYLAVHPFAAQNLTVKVSGMLDGNSVAYTHTTATTVGLSRSRIGGLAVNLQQLTAEPIRFSIAEGKYVTFSPGNLQYLASSSTWRFAEHQYDYIGDANKNIAQNYTDWIDLFGWGTSGWNNGNKCYQPYDNSNATSGEYASSKGYGYGPTDGKDNYLISLTGDYANADWGVYNAIYNPKTGSTDDAGTWRTLTKDEWVYLLGTEAGTRGASGWWIYNMVTIEDAAGEGKDVLGLIIYPDGVTAADLSGFTGKANFSQNSQTAAEITKAEFETLEAMGCVFLPTAGYRSGTSVDLAGSYGYYWSSTYYNSNHACRLVFYSGNVYPSHYNRYLGLSVRLVKKVE